jgi:hypothetical protein
MCERMASVVDPEDWESSQASDERHFLKADFAGAIIIAILLVIVAVMVMLFTRELVVPALRWLHDSAF